MVNGKVGEDQGPSTFISRNGASVVDYLLCKECNFSNITCFNVNSMNEWSDHTPISFSLSCNNVLVSDDDVYYREMIDSLNHYVYTYVVYLH